MRAALHRGKKVYQVIRDNDEIDFIDTREIHSSILSVAETRLLNEATYQYNIPTDRSRDKIEEASYKYPSLNHRQVLHLAIAMLISEATDGVLGLEYMLKWKLPRQYKIDTRDIRAKIGMIKIDKIGRRKALKLLEKHGSIKIVAKILQIPESILKYWIRNKERFLKRWDIKTLKGTCICNWSNTQRRSCLQNKGL